VKNDYSMVWLPSKNSDGKFLEERKMKKKSAVLFLWLAVVATASAVTTVQDAWKGPAGGGTSQDWFAAGNWTAGVPAIQSDYATTGKYGVTTYNGTGSNNYDTSLTTCPVINDGDARAVEIRVGGQAVTVANYTTAYLVMNSGTLATQNWLAMGTNTGAGDRSGIFYMHGGEATLGGAFDGVRTSGHLYVGNGTVSASCIGKLFMDGGTIDAGGNFTIANGLSGGQAYLSGEALITANNFSMRPNSSNANSPLLDISGLAKIIVNGDVTGNLGMYVANGWIKVNNVLAARDVNLHYDFTGGKTTIYAIPEPATLCLLGLGALGLLRRRN
jgi:hypothetical protein